MCNRSSSTELKSTRRGRPELSTQLFAASVMEWNGIDGMQCSGVQWNGVDGMHCSGAEWNGVDGMHCSGVEWNGVDGMQCSGVQWDGVDGMQCIGVEWNGCILGRFAHCWLFVVQTNAKSKCQGPFSAAYQTSFFFFKFLIVFV